LSNESACIKIIFQDGEIDNREMRPLMRANIRMIAIFMLASLFLLGTTNTNASANLDEEERYRVEMPTEDGWHGVRFDNTYKDWSLPSQILGRKSQPGNVNLDQAVCKSLDDPECLKAGWLMNIRSLFDKCESDLDRDCIVSFKAITADGQSYEGRQEEVLKSKHTFEGDRTQGIPQGTGAGIWKVNDGRGENSYALVVGMELTVTDVLESRAAGNDSRITRNKMIFALQPVENVTGWQFPEVEMSIQDGLVLGNGSSLERGCFVVATGYCALRKAFPENIRYELTARFSKGVQGWMVGRIQDSSLITRTLPTMDGFEVTVAGKASTIGEVLAWSKWKDTSQEVRDLYTQGVDGIQWRGDKSSPEQLNPDPEKRTLLTYLNEAGEKSIRHFSAWLPLISDRATAMRTRWNLQSVRDQDATYTRCTEGRGISGVVNSNASVYSEGPPIFNKATQALEYKVAAPHYRSDGLTLHRGHYDLAIRGDVARCIYGFSDAPISATVSIESDSGTSTISTESVTERDGWIRLTATGFTYSSPTIKVQLTQSKSETPKQKSKPEVIVKKLVKKKTICVKGDKKRILTGKNATCPKGFKLA
jgi:hypothetical protein